ncbi:putative tetraacyldisaccharide 4'-kinase, mitochondrial isoform X2 [Silene latifolia]|uniref:putative tetraacyldisaccharide 4'-kinase, mitochondrial isoform X2 n=1 Tax=Silene latifolia TaxID=37657 RepID=UPI003D7751A9
MYSPSSLFPWYFSPTQGYAGGDEVRMLERHLVGTFAKVGVGANRAMTASWFLERYSYTDSRTNGSLENLLSEKKVEITSDKISAIILDDGMQHISLARDLDIVMVNGLTPWGNNQLVPLGPLRQPLSALRRADIVVIHHADLVSKENLDDLKLRIQEIKKGLPVFFSRMLPSHFLAVHDNRAKIPLSVVEHMVLLCVSAIGSPSAFIKCLKKLGPLHIDQLHFSDHHQFNIKDICEMKCRLEELQNQFGSRPVIVTTEKDYERDRKALLQLHPFEVLVLCSKLQLVSHNHSSEKGFKKLLKQLLDRNPETPAQVTSF